MRLEIRVCRVHVLRGRRDLLFSQRGVEIWGIGEELGLNRKKTATPLRVALTGRMISPPLFESFVLVGRDRSLARIRRAIESAG